MCGIVGYIGNKKAKPVLINGLKALEYRGYDSAGIATLNRDDKSNSFKIEILKEKGKVKNLEESKDFDKIDGNIGIAHTRWATHGVPSKINAHPHLDNSKRFALVHNGIIENYNELKEKLIKKGYNLYSQTDTEIIPNLIDYYFKKNGEKKDKDSILKSIVEALNDLNGSYAIEVISPIFPDEIIIARKDSPIVVGIGDGENYIASDIPAILKYTNKFYFVNEKEIAIVKKDEIKFYNFDLNEIKKEEKNIEMDAISAEKCGYEDYMLKEIYEEPKVIRKTISYGMGLDKKIDFKLDIDFSKFNQIYMVACGTAMHAGKSAQYTFEHFTKLPTFVDIASEFRYRNPLIDEKTLCIFISQSGETADTIAALKLAKENKSTTIAIANVIDSSITRVADYTLYTYAGPEIAVASTKAYTCQVTLLNMLAIYMAEKLGNTSEKIDKVKSDLLKLPEEVKKAIEISEEIKEFSEKIYKEKDIFFIGRGIDYSSSMEGSLKLKEISYIHSESYPAGELKHGPISLIEKGTTVVGIVTDSKLAPKTVSNLEEVMTRGAKVLLITNDSINKEILKNILDSDKNHILILPKTNEFLAPVISIIPMQLMAYYIAKSKNLDVDKPRNLAKSVTVE